MPAAVASPAVKNPLLRSVPAGIVNGCTCGMRHALHVQVFEDNRAVSVGSLSADQALPVAPEVNPFFAWSLPKPAFDARAFRSFGQEHLLVTHIFAFGFAWPAWPKRGCPPRCRQSQCFRSFGQSLPQFPFNPSRAPAFMMAMSQGQFES